jgi:hypothetical protein
LGHQHVELGAPDVERLGAAVVDRLEERGDARIGLLLVAAPEEAAVPRLGIRVGQRA